MTSLALLGSTGSIGRNTLNIVARFPDRFQVKTLTAKTNVERLVRQIHAFHPELVAVFDEDTAHRLKKLLPSGSKVEIVHGADGYQQAAVFKGVDLVVGAMVGSAGLGPTLAAIHAGKDIALANKETLVMAGPLVKTAVADRGVRLLPIDSEHSAIFQCLHGHRRRDLDKIILTASGGPFLNTPAEAFARITPKRALAHPNWDMGAKISIDSATLMNKGLEVIEAKWLFDLDVDQIEVIVHPQSIIHSMVAFCDGSMLAQMGIPDMQTAIAYALAYPQRVPLQQPLPDLAALGQLTFQQPDLDRFPCLKLAFDACRVGGTLPAVLNAVNEVAVDAFLTEKLPFSGISRCIEEIMAAHAIIANPDMEAIVSADAWARHTARAMIADRAAKD